MLIAVAIAGILAAVTLGAGVEMREAVTKQIEELQLTLNQRADAVERLTREIDETPAPDEVPTPDAP